MVLMAIDHVRVFAGVSSGSPWNLAWLYGVWAIAVVALYFPCRAFAALKARRNEGWLRYF